MTYIKLNHDFQKFLEQSYYIEALNYNSEAACVLRLHLLAEQFLNVFLDDYPEDSQKKFLKLRYFDQKNRIAVALGMPAALADAFSFLGNLRNKFAHNIDYKLDRDKDISDYIKLINEFQIEQFDGDKSLEAITQETSIRATNSKTKQERDIYVKDSASAAFTISTYILLTKAGIWAVNALNQAGKLNTTKLAPEDFPQQ